MDLLQEISQAPMIFRVLMGATVFVVGFVLYVFVFSKPSNQKTKTPHTVRYNVEGGKPIDIDMKRGAAIFGSSGAGKSRSGFIPIFKAAMLNRLSMVNYDYKDFELVEMLNYFYHGSDIPNYTVSPARIEYSNRCNPLHPNYVNSLNDVNSLANAFMSNLGSPDGKPTIWDGAAESAFAGVCWRLKEDYPEHCHVPMAAAVIMGKDPTEVLEFIRKNQYASLVGKTFLDSGISEKTLGSVAFNLSNAMRRIISPEIFHVFSGNDFDLAINKAPAVLNVVNHPKYDTLLAPFLALVIRCSMNQMSERGRNPSILSMDEASTIKLHLMERIPALLRSYEVGTVIGMQDKIQGVDVYGENKFKAIITNLGVKLLGKVNDADTAEYYQKLFELIEVEQVSISKGSGLLANADARENVSMKEKAKHRAHEFYKLTPGHFFVFDEKGESHKVKFKAEPCEPIKSKITGNYSKTELELNFKKILDIGKSLT
jgi:type IV secretory pathway TraG/TraD family ATPase VirD4